MANDNRTLGWYINRGIAYVLIFALLSFLLRDKLWWLVGIIALLIIIRLIADLYWKGKDKNWWE